MGLVSPRKPMSRGPATAASTVESIRRAMRSHGDGVTFPRLDPSNEADAGPAETT